MPNHVTNQMTIRGSHESIARFKAAFFRSCNREELIEVDFNGIVPMPVALMGTEKSSTSQRALKLLELDDHALLKDVNHIFHSSLKQQLSEVTDWETLTAEQAITLLGQYPLLQHACGIDLTIGRTCLECKRKYGYANWYDWSIEKWGTKWNAYHQVIHDYSDNCICVDFDTAWSPPEPIYEAIAEQFPDLWAEIHYIDEGLCFAGTYTIYDGVLSDYQCQDLDEMQSFAIEQFGWEFYEEEDE